MLKKILLGMGVVFILLVAAFLVVVGPWPVYTDGFEGTDYYTNNLQRIDKNAQDNEFTATPGPLKVGWGVNLITPEIGVPMAGYGARKGAPTTGVHDELYVKALVISDGKDYAAIVGADMLLVPPNVADLVREEVAKQTPLTPNDILFGASHTHDGPGAFGPGLASYVTGGKYDPKIPIFLASAFSSAIVKAYQSMETGKIAHSSVMLPDRIRNRARKDGPVDPELSYLVAQKDSGARYVLVNFSAHPTNVDDDFMQFTAEYPGFLQTFVEKATGATVGYLGGALGSMSPRAPEAATGIERAQLFGEALGQTVVEAVNAIPDTAWKASADVNSVGVPLDLPPFQMRPVSNSWRLSPIVVQLLGIQHAGWMQAVRVGNLQFVGVPCDFSGEISADWKRWAEQKNLDLWTSSFCAGYIGYVSPDKYYNEPDAAKGYETGFMSWIGPHQEAFFTSLMQHMTEKLGPAPQQQAAAPAGTTVPDGKPSI